MENCLKTQLKENIQNSSLIKLGSLKTSGVYLSSDSSAFRKIILKYKSGVTGTATISSTNGNIKFISSPTSSDGVDTVSGNTIDKYISFTAGENFEIVVSNKYDLKEASFMGLDLDGTQLNFSEDLGLFALRYNNFIKPFVPKNTAVTIYSLRDLTNAINLDIFGGSTTLTRIFLDNDIVTGDISNLGGNTELYDFTCVGSTGTLYGDVSSLQNTKLSNLDFLNISNGLYGDLSRLPATCKRLRVSINNSGVFNWSTVRTGNCIALDNITVAGSDIDALLTNMSNLEPISTGGAFGMRLNLKTYPVTTPSVASSVFETLKQQQGYIYINIDGVDY